MTAATTNNAIVPLSRGPLTGPDFFCVGHGATLGSTTGSAHASEQTHRHSSSRPNRPVDLRGQRVLLDSDLVAAGFSDLKSQFATANTPRSERRGRRTLPNAFTEDGAIQAANVLNRPRAIEMGIYVVR
jgi:hypothetical protein